MYEGTLLVVEDDEDIRNTIADALRRRGFAVITAVDGREALTVLDVFRPDVIVLDLLMPVMDGYAFLDLRGERPDLAAVPVVVASAATPMLKQAASTWNEFIAKPFSINTLVEVVERFVAVRRSIPR